MARLKGRIALVTGSAQGMGYAIARALGKEGGLPVILDINDEMVEKAVAALKSEGIEAKGRKLDVTVKSQVREVVAEIAATCGRIDILVNNAGGALHTPHLLAEIEEMRPNMERRARRMRQVPEVAEALEYAAKLEAAMIGREE